MNTNNQATETGNQPAFTAYVVDGHGKRASWRRIGAAWPHKGGGFSIVITPGLAVSGRLVLMKPKPVSEVAPDAEPQAELPMAETRSATRKAR